MGDLLLLSNGLPFGGSMPSERRASMIDSNYISLMFMFAIVITGVVALINRNDN